MSERMERQKTKSVRASYIYMKCANKYKQNHLNYRTEAKKKAEHVCLFMCNLSSVICWGF